jgi:hypothetical protein
MEQVSLTYAEQIQYLCERLYRAFCSLGYLLKFTPPTPSRSDGGKILKLNHGEIDDETVKILDRIMEDRLIGVRVDVAPPFFLQDMIQPVITLKNYLSYKRGLYDWIYDAILHYIVHGVEKLPPKLQREYIEKLPRDLRNKIEAMLPKQGNAEKEGGGICKTKTVENGKDILL